MAEANGGDKPVKRFLDYLALGLILEAASAFWRGESWSRVFAGLVGGSAMLAAHYYWDRLKTQLGERFARTATNVATDFRWWLVPVLLLFLYVGAPTLILELRRPTIPARPLTIAQSSATDEALTAAHLRIADLENQVRQLSQPTPTPQQLPHEIPVQKALIFIRFFGLFSGTYNIKITAPPDNQKLRADLTTLFRFPTDLSRGIDPANLMTFDSSIDPHQRTKYMIFDTSLFSYMMPPGTGTPRFAGFNVANTLPPQPIPENVDATATPAPSIWPQSEVIIHAPSNMFVADTLKTMLDHLDLNAKRGFSYPPDAPKDISNLIYIQIGTGSPWK